MYVYIQYILLHTLTALVILRSGHPNLEAISKFCSFFNQYSIHQCNAVLNPNMMWLICRQNYKNILFNYKIQISEGTNCIFFKTCMLIVLIVEANKRRKYNIDFIKMVLTYTNYNAINYNINLIYQLRLYFNKG